MRTAREPMADVRCCWRRVRRGDISPALALRLVEWEECNVLRMALEADNPEAVRAAWRRAYLGPGISQEELFS